MERDFTRSEGGINKPGVNTPWSNIRGRSVLEFVNKVSACMGAPTDRSLRQQLYDTVFADGQPIRYNGVTYTGPMMLSMYYRNEVGGDEHALFTSRAQWADFADAMRKLRDPDIEIYGNQDLLKLGEAIEARQRPAAVAKGSA